MESRYFSIEKDYTMLSNWWKSWSWQPVPEMFLPEIGIIVSNQGIDVCAGFLYKTDSAGCWAENYISNKDAASELRKGAIEFLVEELAEEAKEEGFIMMFSSTDNKSLLNKLRLCGFSNETNATQLTRLL